MNEKTSIGALLAETKSLMREGAAVLATFAVAVTALTVLGEAGGAIDTDRMWGFGFAVDDRTTAWGAVAAVLAVVVQFVGGYFVIERLLEFRGSIFVSERRIWAYIGYIILSTIGMMIGFLLLIVPGLILTVRWTAAPGYLISRGTGVIDSMQKSWEATKGAGWAIFLAGLAIMCAFLVVALIAAATVELLGHNPLLESVVSAVAEGIVTAVFLAFGVAVFLHVDDSAERVEGVFA